MKNIPRIIPLLLALTLSAAEPPTVYHGGVTLYLINRDGTTLIRPLSDEDVIVVPRLTEVQLSPTVQPPLARMQLNAAFGTTVRLQSLSFNPDGSSISIWRWSFGDGTPDQVGDNFIFASFAEHNYCSAGTFPVTLTVTDNDGQVASTNAFITVPAAALSITSGPGAVTLTSTVTNWNLLTSTNLVDWLPTTEQTPVSTPTSGQRQYFMLRKP